jgi:hypothetical protein
VGIPLGAVAVALGCQTAVTAAAHTPGARRTAFSIATTQRSVPATELPCLCQVPFHWTTATLSAKLSAVVEEITMRNSVYLLAVLMLAVPAVAKGSRGGYGRSSSSHYRSSYSSASPRSRSSASSYSHSYSRPRYSSPHSPSYRSRTTSTYGVVQRDSHGRIRRSAAAKDAFKHQRPCPATGKSTGACPGYVIDHIKPLANGGADDPSNMQWQTKADAKAKDRWERKR